jgi:hypothetical protein
MIALPVLSPYSPEALPGLVTHATVLTSVASAAWATINRLVGYPVRCFSPTVITKLWHYNGGTVSGNLDVGIYDARGTKIVSSGSTAQASINVLQVFDITDTQLGIGDYYFCAVMDGTTGTSMKSTFTQTSQGYLLGLVYADSVFPLPATVALLHGGQHLPIFGALVWPSTVI